MYVWTLQSAGAQFSRLYLRNARGIADCDLGADLESRQEFVAQPGVRWFDSWGSWPERWEDRNKWTFLED